MNPELDRLLRTAIRNRRLLQVRYGDKERVVKPHDYGVHKGTVKLFGFQVGGRSSSRLPNWRWMDVSLISDVKLLAQTFPGGRSASSGRHHSWDEIFIRVSPSEDNPAGE
ncbi:MAG: hypothetical protein M3N54_05945 [Acidobacteriota bacterium]|nr:hypothetical protein [Acidobacteriota bacterium]